MKYSLQHLFKTLWESVVYNFLDYIRFPFIDRKNTLITLKDIVLMVVLLIPRAIDTLWDLIGIFVYWLFNGYTYPYFYNMDAYLTKNLCQSLKFFIKKSKKNSMGYPSSLTSDKKWIEKLEEIVIEMQKDDNIEFNGLLHSKLYANKNNKVEIFLKDYYQCLWD